MITKERIAASQRSKQIVALQSIHREIDDETWGFGYYRVINAIEDALSILEEVEGDLNMAAIESA